MLAEVHEWRRKRQAVHLVLLADAVSNLVDIPWLQTLLQTVWVLEREEAQLLLIVRLVADADLIRLMVLQAGPRAAKQSLLSGGGGGKLGRIRNSGASLRELDSSLFDGSIFGLRRDVFLLFHLLLKTLE